MPHFLARVLFGAGCLVAVGLSSCALTEPDVRCAVRLELTDAESGKTLAGLVRVLDSQGDLIPLEGLLSRGEGLEEKHKARRWWVLPGSTTVDLPRKRLVIEALRGIDTRLERVELDLAGRSTAETRIALRRFHNAGANEWRSANTHLHLQKLSRDEADRYLCEVAAADGLDVLFVSHLERVEADREYITNRYTALDLKALSEKSGVLFGNGEEHRHNFLNPGEEPGKSFEGEGYGHVMFLNILKLIQPVSIGRGITGTGTDGVPLQRGIDEARKDGATVLWCHNTFGLEDIPNWVTGRPHAQNIFDGDAPTDGNYKGRYKDTFYRYLNVGLRVPFSTGTDWFIYDFSRVYAQVPSLKTPRDWLSALEKGRTYITNGPFLHLTADGLTPGDTLRLAEPGRVQIRGQALGRVDFRRVELVRNGEVVQSADSRPAGDHFASELLFDLDVVTPCWLALRIPPAVQGSPENELGGPLFAHTSPVYIEVQGRHVFQAEVARELLADVQRAREVILKSADFADEHEKEHVLAVYEQAITVLERMLNP